MAEKIFAVDKFLGLNESVDGTTELKMGEASKIENFYITDDYNLKNRPGVTALQATKFGGTITAMWDGLIGKYHFLLIVYRMGLVGRQIVQIVSRNEDAKALEIDGAYETYMSPRHPVKFFTLGNKVYLTGAYFQDKTSAYFISFYYEERVDAETGEVTKHIYHGNPEAYVPVIYTDCSPAGGGKELERMNIIGQLDTSDTAWVYLNYARVQFSADGTTTVFKSPINGQIKKVTVDGKEVTDGTAQGSSYTFKSAPEKGVNNVEFTIAHLSTDLINATKKFMQMQHSEAYNGATDNRLFFYGDGTNVCYYTGNPAFGEGLYIPAGNEIAVDASTSAITGMRTQNTRLLAFKPDGAFSIDYEPMTLEDGKVIAGYYVYPVHRGIGNEMDGQVQTVNNYARTLCGGSLYEWRNSASYHKDERYAKRISEKVSRTLAAADPAKIVTCDDDTTQTYYMFLNDDKGTVLVNRYAIDVWTIYTGEVFKGVKFACASQNEVLFAAADTIYRFDTASTFDAPLEEGGEQMPIQCVWESGYMAFGADYKRKYSSNLWVSMLPESNSRMEITVQTDRRDEYLEKVTGLPLLDFSCVDFSNFSFLRWLAPQIKRIKIKVKKFVYYKLIFRVTHPGARATVLGYDQQVRYSSNVK